MRFARPLRIGAGLQTSRTATASQRQILAAAISVARAELSDERDLGAKTVDGWSVNLSLGDPRRHSDLRRQAIVAKHYWGPNVAAESVYPIAAPPTMAPR